MRFTIPLTDQSNRWIQIVFIQHVYGCKAGNQLRYHKVFMVWLPKRYHSQTAMNHLLFVLSSSKFLFFLASSLSLFLFLSSLSSVGLSLTASLSHNRRTCFDSTAPTPRTQSHIFTILKAISFIYNLSEQERERERESFLAEFSYPSPLLFQQ